MALDFLEPGVEAAVPLRQAAMLLHSMAETDRRWMLARVDAAQRARLQALLDELTALDFPVDADLVREALAGVVDAGPSPAPGLAGWSVDEAMAVLKDESADLIALVLRAGDWPWADGLRARLGVARARAIAASRYAVDVAPSMPVLLAAVDAARSRHERIAQRTAA